MRSRAEIISQLTDPGVIAIIRIQKSEQVVAVAEAICAGGLVAIEITLTVPKAVEMIRQVKRTLGDRVLIGAGTVLNASRCREVIEAGAEFVVTPVLRPELVTLAHGAERVIMLGAYTATEAQAAHEAGADFVKIFPADTLGPNYIKALKAPLPHLKLVPTGGVTLQNVGDWFKAGVSAVGVGSSLLPAKILKDGNWPELTRLAGEFLEATRAARTASQSTA